MPKNSILYKLIIIFIIIAVLPLGVIGYFINKNFETTIQKIIRKTEEMGNQNLLSAQNIGQTAIKDAVSELNKKSTEAIEVQTLSLASQIAQFLYERDKDILNLSAHTPSIKLYQNFMKTNTKDIILYSKHDAKKTERFNLLYMKTLRIKQTGIISRLIILIKFQYLYTKR